MKIETFTSQWNQWLQGNIKSNLEVTDKVSQQAIDILQNLPINGEIPRSLTAILNQFEFNIEQRQKIYAALSGTDPKRPQVRKHIQLNTHFDDFTETYTLKFADGELKASKAELSTYNEVYRKANSDQANAECVAPVLFSKYLKNKVMLPNLDISSSKWQAETCNGQYRMLCSEY